MTGYNNDSLKKHNMTKNQCKAVGLFDGALGARIKPRFSAHPECELIDVTSGNGILSDLPEMDVDLVVSAGYRHIIPADVIESTDSNFINAHISYLPYGKGANPNVWAIVDNEPAGVTLHEMAPEVDSGPIIAQRRVPKYPDDDGRDLYERLITAMDGLVLEWLPDLLIGEYRPTKQEDGGSYHHSSAFDELCEIDLDETEKVGDTIRKLRALTYDPYDNAYFETEGTRYFVSIEVDQDD